MGANGVRRAWATTAWTALLGVGCGGLTTVEAGHGLDLDPIAVGDSLTYRVTNSMVAAYSETLVVTQSSASGFTRKATNDMDSAYYVDTGAIVNGGEYDVSTILYAASGTVQASTFSPPLLILPGNVTAGSTASSTSTQNLAGFTTTETRDVTVNGMESVTVPAGTFTALKVTTIISDSRIVTGPYDYVAWWAPGVGRVKIVIDLAATTTWELTSYTIK